MCLCLTAHVGLEMHYDVGNSAPGQAYVTPKAHAIREVHLTANSLFPCNGSLLQEGFRHRYKGSLSSPSFNLTFNTHLHKDAQLLVVQLLVVQLKQHRAFHVFLEAPAPM